jgi:hypothetical protein
MMRLLRFAFALALLATGAACVHRPALNTYRLTRQDNAAILVPPASPRLADIPPGTGHCVEEGGIRLQPAGKKLRVTVDRGALLNQREPGWLAGWSIRAEAAGCIPAGRGAELAEWIVESTPMDTAAATRLLYPGVISGGYVELGPWSRLEVHSPILREGTPVDAPVIDAMKVTGHGYNIDVDSSLAPSVIGFETAWYGVERNAGGIGYHFAPLSAERNIQGAVAHAPAPAVNYFQFPAEARFFRLFHKSEDNDVLAFVIAGSAPEDLERRTKAVGNGAATCAAASGMCLALPRRVGVNPFVAVRVNGREVRVPVPGANVAAAIRAAGVANPDSVTPRLLVRKRFGGRLAPVRFDANSRDILGLPLAGGEQLSWRDKPDQIN